MIPTFDEHGYLPPGIYLATLEEIEARFGRESAVRRAELESLRWLVDLAKQAGVERLVINGSFVTDQLEPNEVDCVLLVGPGFPHGKAAEEELIAGLPFLQIDLVEQAGFDEFVGSVFATDRHWVPKGMIEVMLWT